MKRRRARLLSKDEEREALIAWQDDNDHAARDRVILAHEPMARKVARRYARGTDTEDDLYHEAVIAMMAAADSFDREQGWRFSTYAWHKVRGRVGQARHVDRTVKIGSAWFKALCDRSRTVSKILAKHRHDHRAAAPEIAHAAGVTEEQAMTYLTTNALAVSSLDVPVFGEEQGGITAAESLPCPAPLQDEQAERVLDAEEPSARLADGLAMLTPRERNIIEARHLCDHEDRESLRVIAVRHAVSPERVRQIETVAMAKLTAWMVDGVRPKRRSTTTTKPLENKTQPLHIAVKDTVGVISRSAGDSLPPP